MPAVVPPGMMACSTWVMIVTGGFNDGSNNIVIQLAPQKKR